MRSTIDDVDTEDSGFVIDSVSSAVRFGDNSRADSEARGSDRCA